MRHGVAIFLGVSFFCLQTQAFFELGGMTTSENLKSATTTTNGRTIIDFSLGFSVDNKGTYLLGWNYVSHATTDATTTTTTYAATHMGPRILVNFGKGQNWQTGLSYLLVSNAKYDNGSGSAEQWEGTAIKVDLGYGFDLTENLQLSARLNYLMATYNESLTNGTTYAQVSYAKTALYPSLNLVWKF